MLPGVGVFTTKLEIYLFLFLFFYIYRYFLYVGQKLLSIPAEVEWKKGRAGSIQASYNQLCKGQSEDTEKLARN